MRARFSQSFKIQAVEKALSKRRVTSLKELAESLGIGCSTLENWIRKSKNQEFESVTEGEIVRSSIRTKEKRPHDWSLEEKLNMIILCGSLDDEAISSLCREKGVYPHHITQWKQAFVSHDKASQRATNASETREVRQENRALKKELNRKDKALAETAALLVLQKKVNEIWGNNEGS